MFLHGANLCFVASRSLRRVQMRLVDLGECFFFFFFSLFVFLLGANLCFVTSTACKLHTTRYQGGRYMSTMTEKSPNMSS